MTPLICSSYSEFFPSYSTRGFPTIAADNRHLILSGETKMLKVTPDPRTHIFVVHFHYDLTVRLHACSPPRPTATQLARSSMLNSLISPTALSFALVPASRAHQASRVDLFPPLPRWKFDSSPLFCQKLKFWRLLLIFKQYTRK